MSSTRTSEAPPALAVLRGIPLHSQPHVLRRPLRHQVAQPGVNIQRPASDQPAIRDGLAGNDASADGAYEAGFAEGRKQGYASAQAAAAAERAQTLREALKETRAQAAVEGRLEGLASGRDEGYREASQAQALAKAQADQAALDRLDQLDRVLQAVIAQAAQWLEQAEDDLVALSHEVVCRILGAEAVRPARLRSIVSHLLAQHGQRTQLAVHLHPDDLAAVMREPEQNPDQPWRWVGDRAVQLGGVVLRSPEGSLDARLETQLAALGDALLAMRRSRKVPTELHAAAAPAAEALA